MTYRPSLWTVAPAGRARKRPVDGNTGGAGTELDHLVREDFRTHNTTTRMSRNPRGFASEISILLPAEKLARYARVALGLCVYTYTLLVFALWALLWLAGGRWWFATLLLLGPRWVYALPLFFLLPLGVFWQRGWLLPLGVSTLVIVWPVMGFNIPVGAWTATNSPQLRVLTYNIQRYNVSQEDFAALLDKVNPDLVAIQECAGPGPWTVPEGWHVEQPRRSELLIASRYPMTLVDISHCRWPPSDNPFINGLYCVVDTPHGSIGFCNLHLETPKPALQLILHPRKILDFEQVEPAEHRLRNRQRETEELANWLDTFPEPKIVAGDFNMPVESGVYQDNWPDYRNAFSQAGLGFGHTKHTKVHWFRFGSRIDHVLISPALNAIRSWVGPDLGSDHLPLITDLSVDRNNP